jgi:transposase
MPQSRPYPSDVSDARWALISPTLEQWRHERHARRATEVKDPVDLRSLWNAILYVNRTGIAWKYLPHDFPPPGTVYYYYAAWRDEGIFKQLNADLTALARQQAGRKAEPTAAIIDTQSIKTSTDVPTKAQGIDANKKIVGRKRTIVTDTLGLLLAVVVFAASITDNNAGIAAINQAKADHPTIVKTWVDTGFKNKFVEHAATLGVDAEVVHRNEQVRGFSVVPRRWVVERTIGWLMFHRRLARDYEALDESSEAMIQIAMIDNVSKRITDEATPTWR